MTALIKLLMALISLLAHPLGTTETVVVKPHTTVCTASSWRTTLNPAESWIIAHEHGEHLLSRVSDYKATHDPNPASSAFGLGQLLYSTREQYYPHHAEIDTTDPCVQLAGMRAYISDRYGDSWAALDFWQDHDYY